MTNQQGAPEAPKGTASDGKTELFNVPGYPLMVRAVDFNRLHAENERLAALVEAQQLAPSAASGGGVAEPEWKWVPVDATDAMVRATDKVNFENEDTDGTIYNVWNTMLAASPTPPAAQPATTKADATTGAALGVEPGAVYAELPAPGVTSEQRRLIGVIADKIEDGTLFQSGIYPKKDLARFVRNMLDTTPTAPAASPTPPAEQKACDTQLLKFYGVTTAAELITAQARHIEKLQTKIPPTPSFAPQRVREG